MKFTLINAVVITALLYLLVTIGIGLQETSNALMEFDKTVLFYVLVLVTSGYLLRYIRWKYYLYKTGIKIGNMENLVLFLSGFSMTFSPAKSGEVVKSYLILKRFNIPVIRTVPAIICERLLDLSSMILLMLIGGLMINYSGIKVLSFAVLFFIVVFVSARNKRVFDFFLMIIEYLPFVKISPEEKSLASSIYVKLLSPVSVVLTLFGSTLAWYFECYSLYLIVNSFGFQLSLANSIFIFCFSSVVGILSMLPGGILVTEGSLGGFLLSIGAPPEIVSVSVILVRLCTLWFSVFIGLICLKLYEKRFLPPQTVNQLN